MNEDIFADDMFAVSDEEHHDISPPFAPSGQRSPSPALQADASTLKRKANVEAEADVDRHKRLRPTGQLTCERLVLGSLNWPQIDITQFADTVSPSAHASFHLEKHMTYEFEIELAAAEDKGVRIDMEGTAQAAACCRVSNLELRHNKHDHFPVHADIHVIKQDAWQNRSSKRRCLLSTAAANG